MRKVLTDNDIFMSFERGLMFYSTQQTTAVLNKLIFHAPVQEAALDGSHLPHNFFYSEIFQIFFQKDL